MILIPRYSGKLDNARNKSILAWNEEMVEFFKTTTPTLHSPMRYGSKSYFTSKFTFRNPLTVIEWICANGTRHDTSRLPIFGFVGSIENPFRISFDGNGVIDPFGYGEMQLTVSTPARKKEEGYNFVPDFAGHLASHLQDEIDKKKPFAYMFPMNEVDMNILALDIFKYFSYLDQNGTGAETPKNYYESGWAVESLGTLFQLMNPYWFSVSSVHQNIPPLHRIRDFIATQLHREP